MTDHGELPDGSALDRVTDEFTAASVPAGLLRAHRVATGVWGRLVLHAGSLTFVWEDGDEGGVELVAGDRMVIPPDTRHHVEPGPDARFRVEFHR